MENLSHFRTFALSHSGTFSLSPFLPFFLLIGCISESPDIPAPVTPDQFPAAPSDLIAPYAGWNYVELRWQDNARNEQGFTLERRFPPSAQWREIKLLPQDSTRWFDEEGIGELTSCAYRVRALNDAGVSNYSNEASATTQLAAPTELMAVALSAYRIDLKWIDNSEKEEGFEIEGMLRDSLIFRARVAANVTTYSDSGRFKPNTTYRFIVRAFRGDVFSETSDVAVATTDQVPPAAPWGLTARTISVTRIEVVWVDGSKNEQGFNIERKTSDSGGWSQITQIGANPDSGGTLCAFNDSGLSANTTYYYRVQAFNSAGNSAYSNEDSATTGQVPPAAPSDLTAEAVSSSQINLNWRDNSGNEDGFRIEFWTNADVVPHPIEVGADVTSYQHTGLQPNTTYTYQIYAFNGAGNSDYSNEASDTTNDIIGAIPASPSNLTAEAVSARQINLNWSDNSNNEDGFRVEFWTNMDLTHVPIDLAADVTHYENTGLQPNTIYIYRIQAFNGAGNSDWSNEAAAATTHNAGDERDFPLGDTGLNITMVWIPAGNFLMGRQLDEQDSGNDEDPQHRVTFARGFWMGKYEVTQKQWTAVMGTNPSSIKGDDLPADNVSWNNIQEFERQVDDEFQLPSESMWEYACRAGTWTRFYWGDDPTYSQISNYSWNRGNSGWTIHPVGQKLPNDWGLYDMSGNVSEWCEDWYHSNYDGAPTDGSAWISPTNSDRVRRGGSWGGTHVTDCRSANRHKSEPSRPYEYGFRLMRSP